MSAVYIPAPSAQPLSDALWGLVRPPAVRGTTDTQYLFPWAAALDGIADILQPFIDAQQLPADTNTQLGAYILANRGKMITVYGAFPPFFKAQAKDHKTMVDEGLLPKQTLP